MTSRNRTGERIDCADRSIQPVVLQILGEDLVEAEVLCVGPEVRIEPAQLVGRTSAHGVAQNRFVRVKNCELLQEFFGLTKSVGLRENDVAANGACYGGDKLHDGLVRNTHRIFENALPEKFGCNPLLIREAAIVSINQDIRINESGHGGRGLRVSSPYPGRLRQGAVLGAS